MSIDLVQIWQFLSFSHSAEEGSSSNTRKLSSCTKALEFKLIIAQPVRLLHTILWTLSPVYRLAPQSLFFNDALPERVKTFLRWKDLIVSFYRWRKKPLSVRHSLTVTVTKLVVTSVMKIWSINGFRQHLQLSAWDKWRSSGLGQAHEDDTVISETNVSPFFRAILCNGMLFQAAS